MRHRSFLLVLATAAALLVPTVGASAAVQVNWSDAFPTSGNVTIPAGTTAILDTDLNLEGLTINGKVKCGNQRIDMNARWILVNGTFRCGSVDNPFTKKLTITLKGSGNGDFNGFGDKYIAVTGGRLEFHGEPKTSWVRLTETAPRGATQLRLEANDWEVGDRIVVASTDFNQAQAEAFSITAVNGARVTLDRPLEYMHYCGSETYKNRTITECAEVGLLSRNITVRGNAASADTQIGGHMMFRPGSIVRIEHTALRRMGQVGRLGRYPLHFHLFGNAADSYIRNTSIDTSYNRFISIHGTRNLRFKKNVGYDTLGHGFYLEDGNEVGNKLVGNLAVLVRAGEPGQLVTPSDDDAAAFWITNPDNVVKNNVAAGAEHSGFWYALPEHPLGPSYDPDIWPRQTPLRKFRGNVSHSVGFAGLMIDNGERPDRTLETTWYNPREVPGDDNSPHVRPRFTDFTSYKSRHYGMWVRTFSGAKFENVAYADNWRSLYLANIRSGPTRDNVGVVRDSLLVGETANAGQPAGWETTGPGGRSLPLPWQPDAELGGVPFYDGPMEIKNVAFANFQPNGQRDAGAITSLFPDEFWISAGNAVKKAKFVNSKKVLMPTVADYMDGDANTIFTDLDGSVTGTAGNQIVVRGSLMHDNSCTSRPGWNAWECSVDHIGITVLRNDGGNGSLRVSREDGKSQPYDGSPGNSTSIFFTLVSEHEHTVSWHNGVPNHINVYTNGVAPSVGANDAARIAFPSPSGSPFVRVNGNSTPAGSLNDLNSGGSKWFYQSSTGLIHLRLAGDSNWVEISS